MRHNGLTLNFSKYSFEKLDQETDLKDQLSARFRLNTQISKNIHDHFFDDH